MFYLNNSPWENYFPKQDTVLQIDNLTPSLATNAGNDQLRQYYEFIPYHPVSTSSEMVGTTIEELLMHNFPTKNSWENSRWARYPEEVIIRMDHRSHIKFVLLRAKINRPIPSVDIYIGDGVFGNFNDTKYVKSGKATNVTEEGSTIKVDGIGNFIRWVFTRGNMKTQANPFGQVSIAQLKWFGKKVNHWIYFDDNLPNKDDGDNRTANVDKVWIGLGWPINDEYNWLHDQNYEISPVDEETKITIRDMLTICRRAEATKDYEILRKIKQDIRTVFYVGNEILNCDREWIIAKSKENYDRCIEWRKRKEALEARRDNFDLIYETSRYEKMILLKHPTPADLLADIEDRERWERERLERERWERERLERERWERERLEWERRNQSKETLIAPAPKTAKPRGNFKEYVSQKEQTKKEVFLDELQYNQGDKDLEPYFVPRAKNAGGIIPTPDINKLRRAFRQGVLTVFGVRLFSSLIGDDWKMREAAVQAFLEYIQNPLLPRYLNKTFPLFHACIEVCKYTTDDKVIQIYWEGLKILQTCLAPPVCGNDIDPTFIQKSIKYFLPIYIKKISEFNDKQRDLTLQAVISIFRHPAWNVGELVKACLDIVEANDGVTPDKQPWNVLWARLEIILRVLDEYGIDEALWDWYNVFVELIIPSLFHQKPDCRWVAGEICVLLYKFVGSDIRNIINDMNHLKPYLKEELNQKMNKVDIWIKRESDTNQRLTSAKEDYKKAAGNNWEPIIETDVEK